MNVQKDTIASDLEEMLEDTAALWESFRGARIFITGGTGFFGRWLLESFLFANRRKDLKASLTLLSRDPEDFAQSAPKLCSDPALGFCHGDIRSFIAPEGRFTHLIHAATESSGMQKHHDRLHMVDTIVGGTRCVLEFARKADIGRMLYVSSGAVYGRGGHEQIPIAETAAKAPLLTDEAIEHDESKRMAEALCAIYGREFGLSISVARCFAFIGPYLPTDAHFAVGNFMRDALQSGSIKVQGDGSAVRSYLYASDLAAWLWTILSKGQAGRAYNVGSDESVTVGDLARQVGRLINPKAEILFGSQASPGAAVNYQVPDIARAKRELGLTPRVHLQEAIARMASWCAQHPETERKASMLKPFGEIDALVFDFDGVMTDNRVIVLEDGREAVSCDRADGLGIAALHRLGVRMLVLSTEKNPVVAARCKKLKLECLQGIDKKEEALAGWLKSNGCAAAKTVYLGNDINDLGCLELVGYPVAVGDAYMEVKAVSRLVLSRHGGKGAVRELADRIGLQLGKGMEDE